MNNQHWYIWCKLTVKTKPAYNYGYTQVLSTLVTRRGFEPRRTKEVELHYSGFTIPDYFVVGYGLDYAEKYRNLPYIGILKPCVYGGEE